MPIAPALPAIAAGVSAATSVAGLAMSAAGGGGSPEVEAGPMERMQLARYKTIFAPVEKALLQELGFVVQTKKGETISPWAKKIPAGARWVYQPEESLPETIRQAAQIRQQYGSLAAAARRASSAAFPAGGGLASALERRIPLMQARDVMDIRARDPEKRWERLYAMGQLGQGISSSLMQAEAQRRGLEANLAMAHQQGLASALSGFGSTAGNLAQYYMLKNALKTPPVAPVSTHPSVPAPGWQMPPSVMIA